MTTIPRVPPSLALSTFAFPGFCMAIGCDCETVCAALGAGVCVAIAGMAALLLFVTLGLVEGLRRLASLNPRESFHPPKEHT